MIAAASPRVEFVAHRLFSTADAEAAIEALRPKVSTPAGGLGDGLSEHPSSGIVPARLPEPVGRDEERYLFCRMNFLKYRAHQILDGDSNGLNPSRECDPLLQQAAALRDRIVEANLRLVSALAGRFATPTTPADELFSEGCLPLMRAVELFDVSRGLCFSTYATHAIRHHFFRYLKTGSRRGKFHLCTNPQTLDTAPSERTIAVELIRAATAGRNLIDTLLEDLPERERGIVSARWGLDDNERPHTYEQIGQRLGLSKERVRVLSHRSMARLQQLVEEHRLEMPC